MVDLVYGRGITDIVREIPLGVISLTAISLGRYTIYQDINPEALKLYRNKPGFKYRQKTNIFSSAWLSKPDFNFAWDDKLVDEFLNVSPRQSVTELIQVFASRDFIISVDSQRIFRNRGYVPHPEKPGWLKYDREAYLELLKSEAQKRNEMMQEIIRERSKCDL